MIVRRTRRRRTSRRRLALFALVPLLLAAGGWWWWRSPDEPTAAPSSTEAQAADPGLTPTEPPETHLTAHEEPTPPPKPPATVLIPPDDEPEEEPASLPPALPEFTPPPTAALPTPEEDPETARASSEARSGNAAIDAARKAYEAGRVLEAREQLNSMLQRTRDAAEANEIRALLRRIADETIFGKRNAPSDPCVTEYTVQSGDRLANIAPQYEVPHDVILLVNGIADATRIRVGQRLKIPRGPFHVRIDKSEFRLDIYLREVYVRSYRVGLGTEGGTPEGTWRVKNRLLKPTYYPPESASDKRIIPPGDPTNPLGTRWIGLEGVDGQALGREGYGIHGTIEPESIGRAVSLGCVRMHNEDVEFLYALLQPGRSTVTIVP